MFSGLGYDPDQIYKYQLENALIFGRNIFEPQNLNPKRRLGPYRGYDRTPYSTADIVDIESDLMNLHKPLFKNQIFHRVTSKDSKAKRMSCHYNTRMKNYVEEADWKDAINVDTLLENPKENYRGLSINRIIDHGLKPLGRRGYFIIPREERLKPKDYYRPKVQCQLRVESVLPPQPTYEPTSYLGDARNLVRHDLN